MLKGYLGETATSIVQIGVIADDKSQSRSRVGCHDPKELLNVRLEHHSKAVSSRDLYTLFAEVAVTTTTPVSGEINCKCESGLSITIPYSISAKTDVQSMNPGNIIRLDFDGEQFKGTISLWIDPDREVNPSDISITAPDHEVSLLHSRLLPDNVLELDVAIEAGSQQRTKPQRIERIPLALETSKDGDSLQLTGVHLSNP